MVNLWDLVCTGVTECDIHSRSRCNKNWCWPRKHLFRWTDCESALSPPPRNYVCTRHWGGEVRQGNHHKSQLLDVTQQSQCPNKHHLHVDPMLGWCWPSVVDGGPTLAQHWVNVSCLMGAYFDPVLNQKIHDTIFVTDRHLMWWIQNIGLIL